MSDPSVLFSLIIFLPCLGALALAFMPKDKPEALKLLTFVTTLAVFVLTLTMLWSDKAGALGKFTMDQPEMQNVVTKTWIPSFNIQYLLGLDGISFPFVVLTAFLCVLSMA